MKNTLIVLLCALVFVPELLLGQYVIGGKVPDPSAVLDVQGTDGGLLLPCLSTTGRNTIISPATGLMIMNSTTLCVEINVGTSAVPEWDQVTCRQGIIDYPLECIGSTTSDRIEVGQAVSGVNVSVPYIGGNGGQYSGQVLTSSGVTGLTATLAAGYLAEGAGNLTFAITGTASGQGAATFALSIGGQTCNFATYSGCGAFVAPGTWKVFSCYNLGAANTSADPFTPSWEINGGYWQWGRLAQAAPGPTGPGAWQANYDSIPGWNTTYPANGSWADGSKTGNDPCPSGFRVPTNEQWDGVVLNNTITNVGTFSESVTNYSAGLKFGHNLILPAAGSRSFRGSLDGRGGYGNYWSSTEGGTSNAWFLRFDSIGDSASAYYIGLRSDGFSVRCIAE